MTILPKGAANGSVPIVCPDCRDLIPVNGEIADVRPGDPIRAFCPRCERTVEVAAPEGIEAFESTVDAVTPTVSEFPPGAQRA